MSVWLCDSLYRVVHYCQEEFHDSGPLVGNQIMTIRNSPFCRVLSTAYRESGTTSLLLLQSVHNNYTQAVPFPNTIDKTVPDRSFISPSISPEYHLWTFTFILFFLHANNFRVCIAHRQQLRYSWPFISCINTKEADQSPISNTSKQASKQDLWKAFIHLLLPVPGQLGDFITKTGLASNSIVYASHNSEGFYLQYHSNNSILLYTRVVHF